MVRQAHHDKPRFKKSTILILLTLFAVLPLYGFMDYPYGVNFQIIRTPLMPLDESNPGKDRFAVRTSLRWINVWSFQTNRFMVDGEEGQLDTSFRYAFNSRLQAGVSIPVVARGGGFMDQYVERFHQYTGVGNAKRDHYPRNTINVSYEPLGPYYYLIDNDPLTTYLRKFENRVYPRSIQDQPIDITNLQSKLAETFLSQYFPYINQNKTEDIPLVNIDMVTVSNPRIFWQYTLWKGKRKLFDQINIGTQHKIPGKSLNLTATPGWDSSLFLVFHKNILKEKLRFRFGISYTKFQITKYRVLDLKGHLWTFRPSLDVLLGKWTFTTEYVYFNSPVVNFGRLSSPTHQLGFSLQRYYHNHKLTFAAIENFITYSTTPDIGFLFSVERIF